MQMFRSFLEHLFNICLFLCDIQHLKLYVLKNFWLSVYMYFLSMVPSLELYI